jgi:RNA polymerase sigma factor (sigma-70 family)
MGSVLPQQQFKPAGSVPCVEQRARDAITAVRAGRTDAFAEIVELYEAEVMTLALALMRDRGGAEELAQDAFVRAYRHLDSFDDRRPFYPWLAKITYRLAQSARQRRAREARQRASLESTLTARPDDDPASVLLADEQAQCLWRAVQALPAGERAAVVLYYRNGLRVSDVAQVMGVSGGTVKTFLLRARRHLAVVLGASEQGSARRLP